MRPGPAIHALFAVLLAADFLAVPVRLDAQAAAVARERAEYVRWLTTAAVSPLAAVALAPVGSGLTLGPADADVPLAGVARHRVVEHRGRLVLVSSEGERPLARGRPVTLGRYTVVASGPAQRTIVAVFAPTTGKRKAPEYFPYDSSLALPVRLEPPERPTRVRLLGVDGVEVEAAEAGSVRVTLGGTETRLRVRRMPTGPEESELEVYFRDATNGAGTYPAGRFVNLVPLGGDRYRLDLNRARNPFCAYSTAYPCPPPWPGNTLGVAVRAGERYSGGGLEPAVAPPQRTGSVGANPAGSWRAALDLAGGPLRFAIVLERADAKAGDGGAAWRGRLCNGDRCQPLSGVRVVGDSLTLEIADYDATIAARLRGDSLTGAYRNVGNGGPRVIPFRAARGTWPREPGPAPLLGRWDATFFGDWDTSPRVFELRNGPAGLEGTVISNSGDYGDFWGRAEADSFSLAHFDGSFVYMLTGRLDGDTLRGTFHAGLRTQTHWKAVRSTGAPHLTPPTEVTRADTTAPFRFAFRDLSGRLVTNEDPRFRGKVVLVDIFGTWCPTCHDAAPTLVRLWHRYHERGLEIVGLAYEVTGDTAIDARQVRRYRDKFGIPFPLLLAGVSQTDEAAATLPQLAGFTAFPTTIFLGRDGRVRRVHAGFYGPATGAQHERLVRELEREVERMLGGD